MKPSALAFLVLSMLLWHIPDRSVNAQSDTNKYGSLKGSAILSPRNASVQIGGGLYGRPSSRPKATVMKDSLLIVLIGGQSDPNRRSKEPSILDQKDQRFSPNLLPVLQNQQVRIRNSDPVYHNVFSLSNTKKFDVGRRPRGEYLDVTFDKPGIVNVFCDIHSNMHAIIYVIPSNALQWAKIANGSSFQMDQIPAGTYELKVYAQGFEELSIPVVISPDELFDLGTITLNS